MAVAEVNAYRTGTVDTTDAGVNITSSRQQFALLSLRNAVGTVVAAPTPILSTHNPVGTLVGTTGAGLLPGNSH